MPINENIVCVSMNPGALPTTWAIVHPDHAIDIHSRGQPCVTLQGAKSIILDLIQLRDGRLVTLERKTIRVWDVKQKLYQCLRGHTDDINGIFLLHDGSLMSYSHDRTIRIWNMTDLTCRHIFNHTHTIYDVIQLRDGRLLSCSYLYTETIQVWDVVHGTRLHVWKGKDSIQTLLELRDGRIASYGFDGLRIWSPSGVCEHASSDIDEGSMLFERKNGQMFVASRYDCLYTWDYRANTTSCVKGEPFDIIRGFVETDDEHFFIACDSQNGSYIEHWHGERFIQKIRMSRTCHTLHQLHDGRLIQNFANDNDYKHTFIKIINWRKKSRKSTSVKGYALFEFVSPSNRKDIVEILFKFEPYLIRDLWHLVSLYVM